MEQENIPDKHKAVLSTQSSAEVIANMINVTPGKMSFQENKDWSGSVVGSYPPDIGPGNPAPFVHFGNFPTANYGSYGAVIYTGTNQQGVADNCAWVLAWHVPGNSNPNKVYVICGPKTKYPPSDVTWSAIKTALDSSTSTSYYLDPDTNAESSARIDPTGSPAKLSAVFDIAVASHVR